MERDSVSWARRQATRGSLAAAPGLVVLVLAGSAPAHSQGKAVAGDTGVWIEVVELVQTADGDGLDVYGAIWNPTPDQLRLVSATGPGLTISTVIGPQHERPPSVTSGFDPVTIPGHAELLMRENGLHLFVDTRSDQPLAGRFVPLTLSFDDGTKRRLDVLVQPSGSSPSDHHHGT